MVALFFIAFVIGLSGAMMPGPVLAGTISQTAKRGFIAGPLIVAGHALLELPLIIALAGGLSRVIGHSAVIGTIGLVGGAVLIWMGGAMIVTSGREAAHLPSSLSQGNSTSQTASPSGQHPILMGILLSLSNPYWTLWWATIGIKLITDSLRLGAWGLPVFFLGHISSDLVWFSAVSLAVAGGRRLLSRLIYRWLIIICGIALVGLGIYFGISGGQVLVG